MVTFVAVGVADVTKPKIFEIKLILANGTLCGAGVRSVDEIVAKYAGIALSVGHPKASYARSMAGGADRAKNKEVLGWAVACVGQIVFMVAVRTILVASAVVQKGFICSEFEAGRAES